VRKFKKENVQSLAICFMNSFANAAHEKKRRHPSQALPGTYLTVSSELLPAIRFYDRISTTALNSYVGPSCETTRQPCQEVEGRGYEGVLLIMQSNAASSPGDSHGPRRVTLLSGRRRARRRYVYTAVQGYDDCITVDMGGTSFDAAL